MARGVDKIEHIVFTILGGVIDPHRVGFNSDTALSLDVHRIQQLLFHIPVFYGAGGLDQPVGQGGFSVVDMGDDREISDF